jgi:hypothetical protein
MSVIMQNQIEERINTFKTDIRSLLPIQVVIVPLLNVVEG